MELQAGWRSTPPVGSLAGPSGAPLTSEPWEGPERQPRPVSGALPGRGCGLTHDEVIAGGPRPPRRVQGREASSLSGLLPGACTYLQVPPVGSLRGVVTAAWRGSSAGWEVSGSAVTHQARLHPRVCPPHGVVPTQFQRAFLSLDASCPNPPGLETEKWGWTGSAKPLEADPSAPRETREELLAVTGIQALGLGGAASTGRRHCPPSAPHLVPCPRGTAAAEILALEPFCPRSPCGSRAPQAVAFPPGLSSPAEGRGILDSRGPGLHTDFFQAPAILHRPGLSLQPPRRSRARLPSSQPVLRARSHLCAQSGVGTE